MSSITQQYHQLISDRDKNAAIPSYQNVYPHIMAKLFLPLERRMQSVSSSAKKSCIKFGPFWQNKYVYKYNFISRY